MKRSTITRNQKFKFDAEKIESERIREELYKSFDCRFCSKSNKVEKVISASDFKVHDPSGIVTNVVVYAMSCSEGVVAPYVDKKPNRMVYCKVGNEQCSQCCETCAYATPIIVGLGVPYSIARNTKSSKGLTIKRVFYRCTNVKRMEQLDSGTVMSTYIRCDHYKKSDDNRRDCDAKNG